MKAQAAVMYAVNEPLRIEEILLDKPARGEVLIRTAFAGVCHSDLHYIEGLYTRPCPCVLGHESAGVVEAVGDDVTYVRPGDHLYVLWRVRVLHNWPVVALPQPKHAPRSEWPTAHYAEWNTTIAYEQSFVVR